MKLVHGGGLWRLLWALCTGICLLAPSQAYRTNEHYRYLSYAEINEGLLSLARRHRDILRVFSANSEFKLPYPGFCRGLRSEKQSVQCEVLVAEVGLRPVESTRPQVLIVGSIHGDERLGAQVAYHLVKLMLVKYRTDPWLQRLVKTRRVTVVPIPNPFGYDRSMRYEEVNGELVDPNTDFPFDQTNELKCMQSITARAINELFRTSLFRIAVVFHAKKQPFIGYSWGGSRRCVHANATEEDGGDEEGPCTEGWETQDELALRQLAQHMSTFAGDLGDEFYKVGSLNDPELDSTFKTTMVDWAYGASLPDGAESSVQCRPTTYGGYDAAKTVYNNASNHCLTYIVETSKDSSPLEKELGEPRGLYARLPVHGNGHIPRNMRLALMAIDIAHPYIFFLSTPGARVDIARGGILRLKWSVGGSFDVAETFLEFEIDRTKEKFTTPPQSGGSMWAQNHGIDGYEKRFHVTEGIFYSLVRGANVKWAYSESVRLLNYIPSAVQKTGSDMRIRAVAKVDQSWAQPQEAASTSSSTEGNETSAAPTTFLAQSHIARARSDPSWSAKSGAFEIRGSEYVYSETISVRLPPKTLRNSYYGYVLEMVFMALLFCALPPLGIVLLFRRNSGNYVQVHWRRAMRAFSQKDISEEVARIREQRKPGKVEMRRQV